MAVFRSNSLMNGGAASASYAEGMLMDPSQPIVDIVLLVTACSFTLLVGIILGFYMEGFYSKQIAVSRRTEEVTNNSSVHYSNSKSEDNNNTSNNNNSTNSIQKALGNYSVESSDTYLLSVKPNKVIG